MTNIQNLVLYNMTKKSMLLAYVLGFFLGMFGLHMAYIKEYGHFAFRLGLCILGCIIPPLVFLSLVVYFLDVVVTYYLVARYNNNLKVLYDIT